MRKRLHKADASDPTKLTLWTPNKEDALTMYKDTTGDAGSTAGDNRSLIPIQYKDTKGMCQIPIQYKDTKGMCLIPIQYKDTKGDVCV